jgi:hypothetical protein
MKIKIKLISGFVLAYILISVFLIFEVRNNLFSRASFQSLVTSKDYSVGAKTSLWSFFTNTSSESNVKTKVLVPMGVNDNQKFQLRKIKFESTELKKELNKHSDKELGNLIKDSIQRKSDIKRPELSSAFVNEQIKKAIQEKRQANLLYAPKRMTDKEIEEMLLKKNIRLTGQLNPDQSNTIQARLEEKSTDILKKHLPKEVYDKLQAEGKSMSPEEAKDILSKYIPEAEMKKLTESNAGRKKLSMEEIDTILKEKLPQEIYKKVLESYEKPSSGLLASHEMKFILRKYLPRDTYRNILFSLRAQGRPATPEEIEYAKKNNIPIQSAELDEDHL